MSPVPQFKDDDDDMEEDLAYRNGKRNKEKSRQSCSNGDKFQSPIASNFNVSFTRTPVPSSLEQIDPVDEINVPDLLHALGENNEEKECNLSESDEDIIGDVTIQTNLSLISELNLRDCGVPLPIFTEVRFHRWRNVCVNELMEKL